MRHLPRNSEQSEIIAIEAIGFLAQEEERLERFLSLTGLDQYTFRQSAQEPAFLAYVLDYIYTEENLMQAFAAQSGRSISSIVQAHSSLTRAWEGE